jgi:1,4-alpha-glucan branching enzyme
LIRRACSESDIAMITPQDYLRLHPTLQRAEPAASSWGEAGYWSVWLNEKNEWIYRQLNHAQERMTELANHFDKPTALQRRALQQAARELMLAQASDWPFIISAGTSPDFAERRVKEHLRRFFQLYEELSSNKINEEWLHEIEEQNNIFPDIDYQYWTQSAV